MKSTDEIRRSAEDGKKAFRSSKYESAAETFAEAARAYAEANDPVNAAEMKNNLSVALLKLGRHQESYEAARGTDEVFGNIGDRKRQGMAIGNEAAALEGLGRLEEALAGYERSAQILGEAGARDLKALVLQGAAGIRLRQGKVTESGIRMIGALESKEHPSIFERLLRFLLRVAPH